MRAAALLLLLTQGTVAAGVQTVHAVGRIRGISSVEIVVDAEDDRVLTCRVTARTEFSGPDGRITPADLEPGMRVKLEAHEDDRAALTAVSVELEGLTARPVDVPGVLILSRPLADDEVPRLSRGQPKPRKTRNLNSDADRADQPAEVELLVRARKQTAEFERSLPNFLCQQVTRRYLRESARQGWVIWDTITAELLFLQGQEHYSNIRVDRHQKSSDMLDFRGQRSVGEYATFLNNLMSGEVPAEFHREHDDSFRNRDTAVFAFHVERKNSDWQVSWGGQTITPAYSGRLWIDRETARVLRLEREAEGVPVSFPLENIEQTVEYAFVQLENGRVLLPVASQNLTCERGKSMCRKNAIDFHGYKKFRGDSRIEFGK